MLRLCGHMPTQSSVAMSMSVQEDKLAAQKKADDEAAAAAAAADAAAAAAAAPQAAPPPAAAQPMASAFLQLVPGAPAPAATAASGAKARLPMPVSASARSLLFCEVISHTHRSTEEAPLRRPPPQVGAPNPCKAAPSALKEEKEAADALAAARAEVAEFVTDESVRKQKCALARLALPLPAPFDLTKCARAFAFCLQSAFSQ